LRLPVIEYYDYLRNIRVPDAIFISSKSSCGKPDRPSYGSDDSEIYDDAPLAHAYCPQTYSPISKVQTSIPPSQNHYLEPRMSLPPLNSSPRASPQEPKKRILPDPQDIIQQQNRSWAPLSSEDRRALDRFRVVL